MKLPAFLLFIAFVAATYSRPLAQTEQMECMPYDVWAGVYVPQYDLELIDAATILDRADRLEYWASSDRKNSALLVVTPDGGACVGRTLVLNPTDSNA